MKYLSLAVVLLASQMAFATPAPITYFSCKVKEPVGKKKIVVTVRFAIQGLDIGHDKGELIPYPGVNVDEVGMISVTPEEIKDYGYPMMTNLNGQGGDLRLEGNNIRLFGDGDGYQFTELVIWDADEEDNQTGNLEGYVRDYGSTYGAAPQFKQFIKCKRSDSVFK